MKILFGVYYLRPKKTHMMMNIFGDMYIYVGVDGTGEKRDMTGARHTVPFLAKTSSKICSVVTCTDRSVGHQGRPLTTIRVGYQFDWFADTVSVLRRPATLALFVWV